MLMIVHVTMTVMMIVVGMRMPVLMLVPLTPVVVMFTIVMRVPARMRMIQKR